MRKRDIKIKLITIRNLIGSVLLFAIFTLMIGHTVNTRWIQSFIPNGTFFILLASGIVFLFFRRKTSYRIDWKLYLPFFLIYIIAFLFAIINESKDELEKLIYIYISLFLLHQSNLNHSDISKIGLLLGLSTIYMAQGFKNYGINSLGIIFSFGIVGIINYIDCKLNNKKVLIYLLLSIFSILFVSLTRMRGAIAAITILYTFSVIKELNTTKKKWIALIFLPLILVISWNTMSNFFDEFLFVNKWGGSDVTTGRLGIWNYILNNAGIWGLGQNYIPNYAHAHNTLIHFIGRYGFIILPIIIIAFVKLLLSISCIPRKERKKNCYIRITLVWCILSITETIDFVKVPLYLPQFMMLLYFATIDRKEILHENQT